MSCKELKINDIVVRKTTSKTHDDAIRDTLRALVDAYTSISLMDSSGATRTMAKKEARWAVEQVLKHIRIGWYDDLNTVMDEIKESNKKVQD